MRMRSKWALILILSLLSIGLIVGVHLSVSATKNDVVLKAVHTEGDLDLFSGLHLDMKFLGADHLYWETHFEPAKDQIRTEFKYLPEAYASSEQTVESLRIYGMSNMGVSSSGSIVRDLDTRPLANIVRDIGSRTEPGTTHSETFQLKHYSEYLPLQLDMDLSGYVLATYGDPDVPGEHSVSLEQARGIFMHIEDPMYYEAQKFLSYLKIPTPDEYAITVEVTKNPNGVLTGYGFSSDTEHISLYSPHVVGEKGCWFSLINYSSQELDYSQIPGGLGIYYIPFAKLGDFAAEQKGHYQIGEAYIDQTNLPDSTRIVLLDQVSTAFSLPDTARVLGLSLNEEETQLRACVWIEEKSELRLYVLDLNTKELLMDLYLMEWNERSDLFLHEEEDFFVVMDYFDRLVLLEEDDKGLPQVAIDMPMNEKSPILGEDYYPDLTMTWDGEKLAVGHFMFCTGNFSIQSCNPRIGVYTRDGRYALAEYENSLSRELNIAVNHNFNHPQRVFSRNDLVDTVEKMELFWN